jgi:hypothetical protein
VAVEYGHDQTTSLKLDYATRVENAVAAAGITNIQAVIACNAHPGQSSVAAVAFSASSRFDSNTVGDIAAFLDTKFTGSQNSLHFRLSSLATSDPWPTDHITPCPPFGRDAVKNLQLRLDDIPEKAAESHLPAAMKIILGLFVASQKLWDPTTSANAGCLPNNHTFHHLTPNEVQKTRYTPPTLLIRGVTLATAALCLEAVRTTCRCPVQIETDCHFLVSNSTRTL